MDSKDNPAGKTAAGYPDRRFVWSRFRRYAWTEIKDAVHSHGLFILVSGLMPVILFTLFCMFSLAATSGQKQEIWNTYWLFSELTATAVSIIFFLVFPISMYGKTTDRTAGTGYILLPASQTEKFLSAVFLTIILVPAVTMTLYFSSDALVNMAVPDGKYPLLKNIIEQSIITGSEDGGTLVLSANTPSAIFLPCIISAAGLAGALAFRKNKAGKTFIICTGAFILYNVTFWTVVERMSESNAEIMDAVSLRFGCFWYALQILVTAALLIYFWNRLKKIQL